MDRVDKIAGIGSLYAALLSAGPVLVIYLIEPIILHLFLPVGSPSHAIAMRINMFALWGFIPFGVSFVLSGIVRATGSVWPPLFAMIISMWIVRVPFAHTLMPYIGADAIWWSFRWAASPPASWPRPGIAGALAQCAADEVQPARRRAFDRPQPSWRPGGERSLRGRGRGRAAAGASKA
uniref:Uncharacterized protein n=1 Tax=Phenylobacterium glaciei TaxID=2803784 RepID=A0A974P516_9CAUL|nr:hypothetical protein JKL49_05845 [Phenylobacterium glaciei]